MNAPKTEAVVIINTQNKYKHVRINPNWKPTDKIRWHLRRFIKRHGIAIMMVFWYIIIAVCCSAVTWYITTKRVTREVTETLTAQYNTQLNAYKQDVEARLQSEQLIIGDASRKIAIEEAATLMAKSFYGHRNVVSSDQDYYTLGWVEWFRVVSGGEFATLHSLEDVIKYPNAFMGYSDDNPVIEFQYVIAKDICTAYFEGRWPTTEKFVYLDWSSGQFVARNQYDITSRTEYWHYGS